MMRHFSVESCDFPLAVIRFHQKLPDFSKVKLQFYLIFVICVPFGCITNFRLSNFNKLDALDLLSAWL